MLMIPAPGLMNACCERSGFGVLDDVLLAKGQKLRECRGVALRQRVVHDCYQKIKIGLIRVKIGLLEDLPVSRSAHS